MRRTIDIDLTYQRMIDAPPIAPEQMYGQACASDEVTIKSWRETWLKNYQSAKDRFGTFKDKTFGKLGGINRHKPIICLASGPSLQSALPGLRRNQASKHPIMVISALHNFAYLKDEGIKVDYWVTMDAGEIVLDDTTEFGSKEKNFYWDQTKGEKLLACIASTPKLFDQWQGEVFLFNFMVPNSDISKKFQEIERCAHYISSGGNVGGGTFYIAKAVFGSNPVILCGYDFCFSYDSKFHPVSTKYDNFEGGGMGTTIDCIDVFGNKRKAWPSYWNFKLWQEFIAMKVPGTYINCSEGILGAYREGNIKAFQYMSLEDAVAQYRIADTVKVLRQENGQMVESEFDLEGLWNNSQHEIELTLF